MLRPSGCKHVNRLVPLKMSIRHPTTTTTKTPPPLPAQRDAHKPIIQHYMLRVSIPMPVATHNKRQPSCPGNQPGSCTKEHHHEWVLL